MIWNTLHDATPSEVVTFLTGKVNALVADASLRLRRRFPAVKRLDTIRVSGIKQTTGFPPPDLQ